MHSLLARSRTALLALLLLAAVPAAAQGNFGFDNVNLYKSYSIGRFFDTTGPFVDASVNDCNDCYTGGINIGFDFVLYGQTYNTLKISSNGFITFDLGAGNVDGGATIPGTGYPPSTIAFFGSNLYPGQFGLAPGEVRYRLDGTAPNRRFTLFFYNVDYHQGSVNDIEAEMKIFETTNVIEFHYNTIDDNIAIGQDKSAGIQDNTRTKGHQLWRVTGTGAPADNWAAAYDPNPVPLSLTPTPPLSVNGPNTVSYTLVFDRPVSNVQPSDFVLNLTGMSGSSVQSVTPVGAQPTTTWTISVGTGTGTGLVGITLADNDRTIHAQNTGHVFNTLTGSQFSVTQEQTIQATPNPLDFGSVVVLGSLERTLRVTNLGGVNLNVTNITVPLNYTVTNGTNFTVAGGAFRDVTVQFSPSELANYNGVLTVFSNAVNDNSYDVSLVGSGTDSQPAAPSNPGTAALATDSITWSWTDNSSNESDFRLYAGPGPNAPGSLTTTVGPNVTQWQQDSLLTNTLYSFQVSAFNSGGESAKTANISRYTRIQPLNGLIFTSVGSNSIRVSSANTPSNLSVALSGVQFTNTTVGVDSGWQKNNIPWFSGGLTSNTSYMFTGNSRNGDGAVNTAVSASAHTLAGPPVIGTNVAADRATGLPLAGGTMVTFSNPVGFGSGTHGGSEFFVSGFQYDWNTNLGFDFTGSEGIWNSGALQFTGVSSGNWYLHVRSLNADGLIGGTDVLGPFVFDTVAPTGTIVIDSASAPGPVYSLDNVVTLHLSASDSGGSGLSRMRFSNDGVNWVPANFNSAPAYATTYGPWNLSPGDGLKTVYAQFRDGAGNISTATISDTIEVDTTGPTAPNIVSSTPTNDTTPTWSWTSGGSGDSLNLYRYQLNGTGGAWTETTDQDYTYAGPALGHGATVTLYVQEKDQAGNWSAAASFLVAIDLVGQSAPSVSGTSPTNDPRPTWTWVSGGGEGFYRYGYTEGNWIASNVSATSFTPASDLPAGSHTLFVQERDAANNWSGSGSFVITIDLTPPVPVITGSTTLTRNVRVLTVDFGGVVDGFDQADVSVSNGSVVNVSPAGSASSYAVSVQGVGENLVEVSIPASAATDDAGNASLASNLFSYPFDNVAPQVASVLPASGALLAQSVINVDISFSEDVIDVNASDLVLSGPAASGATVTPAQELAPDLWRITLAGLGTGALNLSLAPDPNDITDVAGNSMSPFTWSVNIDVTPPAISVDGPNPEVTNGGAVSFVVEYTGAVSITLDASDVELLTDDEVTAEVTVAQAKGGEAYVITVDNFEGEGSMTLKLLAGTAIDAAGNVAPEYVSPTPFLVEGNTLPVGGVIPVAVALLGIGMLALRRSRRP